jgi:hypothetical protein
MRMGRRIAPMIAAVFLSSLAGCAFTDVPLDLPISGLAAPASGGNGRQVVVAGPFADERRETRRCGMQKNGYNQDTANVVCKTPPASWIADLLADELRAAGFTVVKAGAPHKPSALKVEGALLQFFVEPMAEAFGARCECDVSVRLDATSQTGLRATRIFFAKGVWQGFAGITGPFVHSVEKASDEVLAEMVEAIVELMNRYPELGASPQRLDATSEEATCAS